MDIYDPEPGSWDPPKSSLGFGRLFTSLDETRATHWTVDNRGDLQIELHDEEGQTFDLDELEEPFDD